MTADQQVFSASSVATFMRCAKQWEYAYVYELKRPPSIRQVLGTAAHSATEVNYKQKVASKTDMPVSDVVDVFSDAFDFGIKDAAPAAEDEKEKPGIAKDSGIKTVTIYQKQVAPKVQPILVEHEGLMHVNGIPYGYSIDLVDDRKKVRDNKWTKRRPSGPESYRLNMIGYALGYRQDTGEKETDIVLDYMVRTKEPYYWPISSGGPVPTPAIENFASILELVNHAVMEGVFLPTGLHNHACSWCGYRDICDAYGRYDW